LDLDKNLAWKIVRAVEQTDPLGILTFLPGNAAFDIFLRAAAQRGVEAPILDQAREAMKAGDEIVAEHAGNRESMEIMIAEFAEPNGGGRTALAQRKAAYQGNGAVLGIQAKVLYKLVLAAPSESPGMVDLVTVRGIVALRWLRPGARWTISTGYIYNDAGIERGVVRKPLVPTATPGDVPLLPQFCSDPLPSFDRVVLPGNVCLDQIVGQGVGSRSAVTFMLGELIRSAGSRYQTPEDHEFAFSIRVTTPCEVAVVDVFAHRSLFGDRPPEMGVYTELIAGGYPRGGEHSRLPIVVPVEQLGFGPAAARPRDVPRCSEMAAFAFECVGWDASEFSLYRVRVEYPPIATNIVMRWAVPEAPVDRNDRTALPFAPVTK
jgi:hypothetical protein